MAESASRSSRPWSASADAAPRESVFAAEMSHKLTKWQAADDYFADWDGTHNVPLSDSSLSGGSGCEQDEFASRRLTSSSYSGLSNTAERPGSLGWQTSKWVLAVAAMLLFVGIWYQPTSQSHPVASVPQAVATRPRALPPRAKPIAEVQLGERLVGLNPLRHEADLVEPEADTWRRVVLLLEKENGGLVSISLLRQTAWLDVNEMRPGSISFLSIPEMGAVGPVWVLWVGPCPPISPGVSGAVVTGRFVHECHDAPMVRLSIDGQHEPTLVTPGHRYWSRDRQQFVAAGELRPGELVDTAAGQRRVAAREPFRYSGRLYNLETTEHVYRVGLLGALVHNACALEPYRRGGGHHPLMVSAFRDHPNYSKYAALSIPAKEMDRLKIVHKSVTASQRRMFDELARSGRAHTLRAHANIAVEALVENGMRRADARDVVNQCLRQLKEWRITAPTGIPWNQGT
ncbi:MAG: hypothetical protein JNG90_17755 [Planctomycetaceae bacterium]|nr:hypothetical protein [Planctomycetaceae bacterium]